MTRMRSTPTATPAVALACAILTLGIVGLHATAAPIAGGLAEPMLQDPGDEHDPHDGETGEQADLSDLVIETLTDQPCQNRVQLPAGAKVGLWWAYTLSNELEYRWAIVAELDGCFVVESPLPVGDVVVIQSYLVDPAVDLDATNALEDGDDFPHNVRQAWVGLRGGTALDRPVMEPFQFSEPDDDLAQPEVEGGEEMITVNEQVIPCRWTEYARARRWVAVDGPLAGLLIKSAFQDSVTMELTGTGEDAKPELAYE